MTFKTRMEKPPSCSFPLELGRSVSSEQSIVYDRRDDGFDSCFASLTAASQVFLLAPWWQQSIESQVCSDPLWWMHSYAVIT
jgi:hypothetical protein